MKAWEAVRDAPPDPLRAKIPGVVAGARLDCGTAPHSVHRMTATLKADDKGRYALGRFLPRKPEVRVEPHPDGSVTLRPVKRRMTRTEAEAFVRSRAGTWDGPISGAELLKLTRGA